MKKYYTMLVFLIFCQLLSAQEVDSLTDKNTAFYEGEIYNYIITPPENFKMNSKEATDDGYSFAFIPVGEKYADASVIIGINIFKIKPTKENPFSLDMLITEDTTAMRKHYGADVEISEVEPIQTATTDKMRTIYINSDKEILPNVMMSYLDGKSEILIFELAITDKIVRFKAEAIYLECLKQIKALTKGKIDIG